MSSVDVQALTQKVMRYWKPYSTVAIDAIYGEDLSFIGGTIQALYNQSFPSSFHYVILSQNSYYYSSNISQLKISTGSKIAFIIGFMYDEYRSVDTSQAGWDNIGLIFLGKSDNLKDMQYALFYDIGTGGSSDNVKGLVFSVSDGTTFEFYSTNIELSSNEWHFVYVEFDQTTKRSKMCVDGNWYSYTFSVDPAIMNTSGCEFRIGSLWNAINNSVGRYRGLLSDIIMFSDSLVEDEVSYIFNNKAYILFDSVNSRIEHVKQFDIIDNGQYNVYHNAYSGLNVSKLFSSNSSDAQRIPSYTEGYIWVEFTGDIPFISGSYDVSLVPCFKVSPISSGSNRWVYYDIFYDSLQSSNAGYIGLVNYSDYIYKSGLGTLGPIHTYDKSPFQSRLRFHTDNYNSNGDVYAYDTKIYAVGQSRYLNYYGGINLSIPSVSVGTTHSSGDLYVDGTTTPAKRMSAFIHGWDDSSSGIMLYEGGHIFSSYSIPLHITSHDLASSDITCFIAGGVYLNQDTTLYINGYSTLNSGIDLSIEGYSTQNDTITLYASGEQVAYNNIPLYLISYVEESGNFDQYIHGHLFDGGNMPLYEYGKGITSGTLSLHEISYLESSGEVSLYEAGHILSDNSLDLYAEGYVPTVNTLDLYTIGFKATYRIDDGWEVYSDCVNKICDYYIDYSNGESVYIYCGVLVNEVNTVYCGPYYYQDAYVDVRPPSNYISLDWGNYARLIPYYTPCNYIYNGYIWKLDYYKFSSHKIRLINFTAKNENLQLYSWLTLTAQSVIDVSIDFSAMTYYAQYIQFNSTKPYLKFVYADGSYVNVYADDFPDDIQYTDSYNYFYKFENRSVRLRFTIQQDVSLDGISHIELRGVVFDVNYNINAYFGSLGSYTFKLEKPDDALIIYNVDMTIYTDSNSLAANVPLTVYHFIENQIFYPQSGSYEGGSFVDESFQTGPNLYASYDEQVHNLYKADYLYSPSILAGDYIRADSQKPRILPDKLTLRLAASGDSSTVEKTPVVDKWQLKVVNPSGDHETVVASGGPIVVSDDNVYFDEYTLTNTDKFNLQHYPYTIDKTQIELYFRPSGQYETSTNEFRLYAVDVSGHSPSGIYQNIAALFTHGKEYTNESITLYTISAHTIETGLPLYLHNNKEPGYLDLYLAGHKDSSGELDLYLSGIYGCSSGIDLTIPGGRKYQYILHLYTSGHEYHGTGTPLYTRGYWYDSGNIPLFMSGIYGSDGSTTLYVHGLDSHYDNMNLFVKVNPPPVVYEYPDPNWWWWGFRPTIIPLYTFGAYTSPIDASGHLDLYTENAEPVSGDLLNLYLLGQERMGVSGFIPLTAVIHMSGDSQGSMPLTVITDELNIETSWNVLNMLVAAGLGETLEHSGTIDLHTISIDDTTSNMNMYIYSNQPGVINDNVDLMLAGIIPSDASGYIDLYTINFESASGFIPAYINADIPGVVDDGIPTFIMCEWKPPISSGHLDMYIGSLTTKDAPLYVYGMPTTPLSGYNSHDMYTYGYDLLSGVMNMSILGANIATVVGDTTLYMKGIPYYASGISDLHMLAYNNLSGQLILFMEVPTPASQSGSFDMYIDGISGVYQEIGTVDLHTYCDGAYSGHMLLFVSSQQKESVSGAVPLFVWSQIPSESSSVELLVFNNTEREYNNVDLVLHGPQYGTSGWIPGSSVMPLYINREANSIVGFIPLYSTGPSGSFDSIYMYTRGIGKYDEITLYLDAITQPYNETLDIYVHGF